MTLQSNESAHPYKIAFISAAILILELALIRFIPAQVRAISYFTNIVLIATFCGLGLGCILQNKKSLTWLMPLGLTLIFAFVFVGRGIVIYEESKVVHFWLQYGNLDLQKNYNLPLLWASIAIFVCISLTFVAMGQVLARSMEDFERLRAYGWDILGSLCGTIIFSVASWWYLPPWIWPVILMLMWAYFFVDGYAKKLLYVIPGILFVTFSTSDLPQHWSPYYYVQHEKTPAGINVFVNSSFHQRGIDFTENTDSKLTQVQQHMLAKWSLPYQWYKTYNGKLPQKILILGAGTGNDVHVAKVNRAEKITAVEIDPIILHLGKTLNDAKPYDSDRVEVHVDDARHFLHNSQEKFDLIIFATLDSQALLSSQANLRLENYVYTKESLENAKNLLNDRGMVAIYYSVFKPWLYTRIYTTLRESFGDHSRIHLYESNYLFNTLLVGAKGIPQFRDFPGNVELYGNGIACTDDWPFIYLQKPTIATLYQKLFAFIILVIAGIFLLLRKIYPVRGLHSNFLLLGIGFTLMESTAIVRLALVFGSTWIINSIVFAAVLLTIYIANILVHKGYAPSLKLSWLGLFAFIAVNYFFPVYWLFELHFALRVSACALLIGIPIFFASCCFSFLFAKQQTTGYALGINLVGAMAGGIIEYSSMMLGMRLIWSLVLVIYLLAYLSTSMIEKTK